MRFVTPDFDFTGKDATTGWVLDKLDDGTTGVIQVKYLPDEVSLYMQIGGELQTMVPTSHGVYHSKYIYKSKDEALFALSVSRVID